MTIKDDLLDLSFATGDTLEPDTMTAISEALSPLNTTAIETANTITPLQFFKATGDPERYAVNTTPGTTDMTAALGYASTVSAAGGGSIKVSSRLRVTANTTIAKGAVLEFLNGGIIEVDSGDTLTVNGEIRAANMQIFDGDGTVVYGTANNVRHAVSRPEWFGAVHDASTDDTAALQAALDMVLPCSGRVLLSMGAYEVRSTLNYGNGVSIVGLGEFSQINFDPSANDDALFEAPNGASGNLFQDFVCYAPGSATGKRCFRLVDDNIVSNQTWRRVYFQGFNDYAIYWESAQYGKILECRFLDTHNATDTGAAISITVFGNSMVIENNGFQDNDRDFLQNGGTAVKFSGNSIESSGSLASSPDVSVELVDVFGAEFSANYVEGVRTAAGKAAFYFDDCLGVSCVSNHMDASIGSVTYSRRLIYFVGDSRGCRASFNTLKYDTASGTFNSFIGAGNYKVEAHGNRYFNVSTEVVLHEAIAALTTVPAKVEIDVPLVFTYDPGSLADGAGETSSGQTMTGASFGDIILVSAPYDLQGIIATGYVSASNTVRVRLQQETGAGPIDLASGSWRARRLVAA